MTKSRGIYERHGLKDSKAYGVWGSMRSRCQNPNEPAYANYGGRGIAVCDAWQKFTAFYRDMGDPPPGSTLERIDNDKGYSHSNCKWASRKEQGRNKRNNVMLSVDGETRLLREWAEHHGLKYGTVQWRLTHGWAPDAAVKTPKITKRKCIRHGERISEAQEPKVNGVPLSEAIAASGLLHGTVLGRLSRGWSIEDALSCPPRKGRRIVMASAA